MKRSIYIIMAIVGGIGGCTVEDVFERGDSCKSLGSIAYFVNENGAVCTVMEDGKYACANDNASMNREFVKALKQNECPKENQHCYQDSEDNVYCSETEKECGNWIVCAGQCCDGECKDGQCSGKTSKCGTDEKLCGSRCIKNAELSEGECPKEETRKCEKNEVLCGETCCSGTCEDGTCVTGAVTSECGKNEVLCGETCCSGTCEDGTCVTGAVTSECGKDEILCGDGCCAGHCVEGICVENSPAGCTESQTSCPEGCVENAQLVDGKCPADVTKPSYVIQPQAQSIDVLKGESAVLQVQYLLAEQNVSGQELTGESDDTACFTLTSSKVLTLDAGAEFGIAAGSSECTGILTISDVKGAADSVKVAVHIVGKSDANGNLMADWFETASDQGKDCVSGADCEIFCDSVLGSRCSTMCTKDSECMDGYVCRTADGRCANRAFVTVWNVSEADRQIVIATGDATCSFTVDWGDGSGEEVNDCTQNPSHIFAEAGEYRVSIVGELNGWRAPVGTSTNKDGIIEGETNAQKLVRVESFGTVGLSNFAFTNCTKLSHILSDDIPVPNAMNGFSGMFIHTSSLVKTNLPKWDTSMVISMDGTFINSAFNEDIGKWNTAKVTDMSSMFAGAEKFNQPIGSWNTAKVTNMRAMFGGAKKFNQPIGKWNTSNVKNMQAMFNEASAFDQDISEWDVAKVSSMDYMFAEAHNFDQDISDWEVSNVSDMSYMFANAKSFNQDIGSWDVSNVRDMGYMFAGALLFDQDISLWDVSKVKAMDNMFYGASKFDQDLFSWELASGVTVNSMFEGSGLSHDNYCSLAGEETWAAVLKNVGLSYDCN